MICDRVCALSAMTGGSSHENRWGRRYRQRCIRIAVVAATPVAPEEHCAVVERKHLASTAVNAGLSSKERLARILFLGIRSESSHTFSFRPV